MSLKAKKSLIPRKIRKKVSIKGERSYPYRSYVDFEELGDPL